MYTNMLKTTLFYKSTFSVALFFHLAIIIKCDNNLVKTPTNNELKQIWESFKTNYSKYYIYYIYIYILVRKM